MPLRRAESGVRRRRTASDQLYFFFASRFSECTNDGDDVPPITCFSRTNCLQSDTLRWRTCWLAVEVTWANSAPSAYRVAGTAVQAVEPSSDSSSVTSSVGLVPAVAAAESS